MRERKEGKKRERIKKKKEKIKKERGEKRRKKERKGKERKRERKKEKWKERRKENGMEYDESRNRGINYCLILILNGRASLVHHKSNDDRSSLVLCSTNGPFCGRP